MSLREAVAALYALVMETEVSSVQPIADRVLCKQLAGQFDQMSPSGRLHVVSKDQETSTYYVALAIGSDAAESIRPGDVVIAGRHVGFPCVFAGETYRLIPEQDILAVLPDATLENLGAL